MIWDTSSKALTLKDNQGHIQVDVGVFKRGSYNGKQIWGLLPRDFQTVISYLRGYVAELKEQYTEAAKAHYRIEKTLADETAVLNQLEANLRLAQSQYDQQAAKVALIQDQVNTDAGITSTLKAAIAEEIDTLSNNNLGECYFHSGEGLYLYDKNFNYLGKYSVEKPNEIDDEVEPPAEWIVDYTLPSEGVIQSEVDAE